MIVLKYSYDTSICASFYPTFNSGYTCTKTEASGGGSIKVVTYESDTAFTGFSIPDSGRECLKTVDVFDCSGLKSFWNTFPGSSNLLKISFSNITSNLTSMYQVCFTCNNLTDVSFVDCDLSSVTNIQNIFNNCSSTIQNVLFKNVKFGQKSIEVIRSHINSAPNMIFENISVANLTSCWQMFAGCVGLKSIDLSNCDFKNVDSMSYMFSACTSLKEVILPKGFHEKLTNMEAMFQGCSSLTNFSFDDFVAPNVTALGSMFGGCTNLEDVDLSSLGAYKAKNINHMFAGCFNLKKLNMSGIGTIGSHSMSHFAYSNTGVCPVEWLDMSNIKHITNQTQNMWRIGSTIKNIGMLYCPSEVINFHLSQMRIPSTLDGYKINIYYHDANPNELTQDDRFNYIYCEEYHGDVVETPNDLELYGVNESIYDKLDLTTGILYKNTGIYTLDETFVDRTSNWNIDVNDTTGNVIFISRQHKYLRDEHNFPHSLYNNAIVSNADPASNIVNNSNIEITRPRLYFDIYSNNNYTVIIMPASYNVTTLDELRTWLQSNNMIINYKLGTPTTKQIDLKALRSYRNGIIKTDSQQLVPELVTTLPIANKFETTKLVNGKTYLVYFDGTATELNAGGETVIANPTSPCEFTCGSTKTLTITGTDIANVMIVEKEQKNEQHEINATSVHINRIRTRNDVHNYFDDYVRGINSDWGKPFECNSIRDLNCVKITGLNGLCYDGYVYNNGNLPQGTYRMRCKVKVGKIGDKYRMFASSNPNANQLGQQIDSGQITSTQFIEEVDVIGYIKNANNMVFYTFYNGQQIEYYDISFIKLSDEDITSSGNIPNISYEETISTPSEPIILREYGGLQDTYDIATGIVTKRVLQSIDSFDLEVLPSPETHTVTFDNMPVIYENGTVEFYTEHGLYPVAKFEVPSLNIYDVSNLQANKQYTVRNANQIYCNGQSVPVRDVMTFTASQLAKGEMVINNDNDKEPMIIEGNFEGREIPSFTGTRSVEALEISVNGGVNQPTFGKGGRK